MTPFFFLAAFLLADPSVETLRPAADRLIAEAQKDDTAWQRLAYFGDRFPSRLAGTENLAKAIAWAHETMHKDGLENVRLEKAVVPVWVRGEESAEMLEPARHKLHLLGLGGSVGTAHEGITGEVLVVKNFEELESLAKKTPDIAKGKIVCWNVPWEGYGKTVAYRGRGASAAAKHGAIATLVRSAGPTSLRTPHTGMMGYEPKLPQIPAASIPLEETQMMQRMQDRGEKIVVRLKMEAKKLSDTESFNVVAEIRGREMPQEIVLAGGHIDSWDVGPSIMDDAGGCIATWEALRLIHKLGLRPRRTIRLVLWTNEESGLMGSRAYFETHENEISNHVLAFEHDNGIFKPGGFQFTGTEEQTALVTKIASLLESVGASKIVPGGGGADIGNLMKRGVPGMELYYPDSNYFDYHHTAADTLDKVKPEHLALSVACNAVMLYAAAEVETFPKKENSKTQSQ